MIIREVIQILDNTIYEIIVIKMYIKTKTTGTIWTVVNSAVLIMSMKKQQSRLK